MASVSQLRKVRNKIKKIKTLAQSLEGAKEEFEKEFKQLGEEYERTSEELMDLLEKKKKSSEELKDHLEKKKKSD